MCSGVSLLCSVYTSFGFCYPTLQTSGFWQALCMACVNQTSFLILDSVHRMTFLQQQGAPIL